MKFIRQLATRTPMFAEFRGGAGSPRFL